jgi:hypothetical protein
MLKKIMIFLSFIPASFIFSMETNDAASKAIRVSLTCGEEIKKINKDGACLYYFFKGAFKAMGEHNATERPSELLSFFAEGKINENMKLTHMPATDYLNIIVKNQFATLDKGFDEEYKRTKNIKQTWEWFGEFFKQKGLQEPLAEYKKQLVKADQEGIESIALENKGISNDGRTVFINVILLEHNEK